jgi:hypothetical protein
MQIFRKAEGIPEPEDKKETVSSGIIVDTDEITTTSATTEETVQ